MEWMWEWTGGRLPVADQGRAAPVRDGDAQTPRRSFRPEERQAELDELRQRGLTTLRHDQFTELLQTLAQERAAADADLQKLKAKAAKWKEMDSNSNGDPSKWDTLNRVLHEKQKEFNRIQREFCDRFQQYVEKFGDKRDLPSDVAAAAVAAAAHDGDDDVQDAKVNDLNDGVVDTPTSTIAILAKNKTEPTSLVAHEDASSSTSILAKKTESTSLCKGQRRFKESTSNEGPPVAAGGSYQSGADFPIGLFAHDDASRTMWSLEENTESCLGDKEDASSTTSISAKKTESSSLGDSENTSSTTSTSSENTESSLGANEDTSATTLILAETTESSLANDSSACQPSIRFDKWSEKKQKASFAMSRMERLAFMISREGKSHDVRSNSRSPRGFKRSTSNEGPPAAAGGSYQSGADFPIGLSANEDASSTMSILEENTESCLGDSEDTISLEGQSQHSNFRGSPRYRGSASNEGLLAAVPDGPRHPSEFPGWLAQGR